MTRFIHTNVKIKIYSKTFKFYLKRLTHHFQGFLQLEVPPYNLVKLLLTFFFLVKLKMI